ncbi:MAG: beta-N-acetylhexosaminidase [Deltaproteobacteria bacterium]|nr:beta-N-acetylhexosaminidase [Deltaproteobacteria bacterium]
MTGEGASLPELCGQLLVGGFAGTSLPASFARELLAGRRGGAILFRRNCHELGQVAELCAAISAGASASAPPPIVGVDQEGGRVCRLPAPFFTLPAMRELGRIGDPALTGRAAEQVGRELHALGFNTNFAPVLDVDTNPTSPVIGDRSFGSDPEHVARHGAAFVQGLQKGGVLACGKHFPGHGDAARDSHVELPVVGQSRSRLDRVELVPFRAAIAVGVGALMSAHVAYPAVEPELPATFSARACTRLLRQELGYGGVLFSDDLEMGAISRRWNIEEAAVQAVAAGCDVLLVCRDEGLQERAHRALIGRAEHDGAFRARCAQAAERAWRARRAFASAPAGAADEWRRIVGSREAQELAERIAQAVAARRREKA